VARQLSMFVLAVFGWVLFRSTDFGMATHLFGTMLRPVAGEAIEGIVPFSIVLTIAGVWAMAGPNAQDFHSDWRPTRIRIIGVAVATGAALAVLLGSGSSPFLYFQF
jgi:hypothetical protein